MGIFLGSEEMNNTCRKRMITVTTDRSFTIFVIHGHCLWNCIPCHNNHKLYILLTQCISLLHLVVRINSNEWYGQECYKNLLSSHPFSHKQSLCEQCVSGPRILNNVGWYFEECYIQNNYTLFIWAFFQDQKKWTPAEKGWLQ